jgi:hypothetical protein
MLGAAPFIRVVDDAFAAVVAGATPPVEGGATMTVPVCVPTSADSNIELSVYRPSNQLHKHQAVAKQGREDIDEESKEG